MLIGKKKLAFALLVILAAPILFFAGYLIKQKILQHEMKEKLEYASLQAITVNFAEIQWVKKDKEVFIDGKLFDVKYYRVAGNKIILTGLFDIDEDKLEKEFTLLWHQKKRDKSAPISQLMLKFIFTYSGHGIPSATILLLCQNLLPVFLDYNESIVNQYLSIITPPPNT